MMIETEPNTTAAAIGARTSIGSPGSSVVPSRRFAAAVERSNDSRVCERNLGSAGFLSVKSVDIVVLNDVVEDQEGVINER